MIIESRAASCQHAADSCVSICPTRGSTSCQTPIGRGQSSQFFAAQRRGSHPSSMRVGCGTAPSRTWQAPHSTQARNLLEAHHVGGVYPIENARFALRNGLHEYRRVLHLPESQISSLQEIIYVHPTGALSWRPGQLEGCAHDRVTRAFIYLSQDALGQIDLTY